MKHTYKITKLNEWKNFRSIIVMLFSAIVIAPIALHLRSPEESFIPVAGVPSLRRRVAHRPQCI